MTSVVNVNNIQQVSTVSAVPATTAVSAKPPVPATTTVPAKTATNAVPATSPVPATTATTKTKKSKTIFVWLPALIAVGYVLIGILVYLVVNPKVSTDVPEHEEVPKKIPPTVNVATLDPITGPNLSYGTRFWMRDGDVTVARGSMPFFSVAAVCQDATNTAQCLSRFSEYDAYPVAVNSDGTRYFLLGAGRVTA